MDLARHERWLSWLRFGCLGAVVAGALAPLAFFWLLFITPSQRLHDAIARYAADTPSKYGLPSPPPRHPPIDSHPEGYEWVHGHQHGSKWVEGYWRRKPGTAAPGPSL